MPTFAAKPQQHDDVVLFEGHLWPVQRTEADDPHQWLCALRDHPGVDFAGEPSGEAASHQLNGTRDLLPFDRTCLPLLERHLRLADLDDVRHAIRTDARIYVAHRRALPPGLLGMSDINTASALREAIEAVVYLNGRPTP